MPKLLRIEVSILAAVRSRMLHQHFKRYCDSIDMSSSTHKASEDGSSHETLSHGSGPVVLPNCLPLYDILYDMQSHLLAGDRSSHVGEKILDRDYSPMFLRKGRFPPALRVASRKHHFDVPQIRTGLGESGCLKGCFRHGGSLRRERDVNAVVVGEEFHGDGGRGKGAEKDHRSLLRTRRCLVPGWDSWKQEPCPLMQWRGRER